MFKTVKEESNFKHQYKIVGRNNPNYVFGRVRFEPNGWNVRCSECDEHIERLARAKFVQHGRKFPLKTAVALFSEAIEELERDLDADAARYTYDNQF